MLIELVKKSRVEFFLAALENREWKENFFLPLSKIESRKRNGNYQIFEIEREISLSTLDFLETLVNAWDPGLVEMSKPFSDMIFKILSGELNYILVETKTKVS